MAEGALTPASRRSASRRKHHLPLVGALRTLLHAGNVAAVPEGARGENATAETDREVEEQALADHALDGSDSGHILR